MKIGDEVYVHGYVDEIRNGVIIIRNEGGYFGTAEDEIICFKAEFHKEHIEPEVIIEPTDEPQTETKTETQNSNKNSNVIFVFDGVSEMIRCAMCNNPNQSYKGCDGVCLYDEKLYKRIMDAIDESRVDTPQTERIKTTDYCDICNHKGCDNCTANSLDDYCVPSGYTPKDTPQIDEFKNFDREDLILLIECQKERIGELLADKDTPQTDCNGCKFVGWYDTEFPCVNCVRKNKDYYDAEQTDCP